jgi:hypothetical protein
MYVGAPRTDNLISPDQLTQLAHAVRLRRLTTFTLAKVVPLVGWLHEPAWCALAGLADIPAAWETSAPGRTGGGGSVGELVWEVPLSELQPLIDSVAVNKQASISSPPCIAACGVAWNLGLLMTAADPSRQYKPRSISMGLHIKASHAASSATVPFRLGREVEVARADGGPPAHHAVSLAGAQPAAPGHPLGWSERRCPSCRPAAPTTPRWRRSV